MIRSVIIALSAALLLGPVAAGAATPAPVRAFLDAYARGDQITVLELADPDVTIFGSDAAEVFHGRSGLERMLTLDHRLRAGPAQIGQMQDVSIVEGPRIEVVTFNAPFQVGTRPPVPVRFTTVWRRHEGRWRLVQCSNVVPTTGQSAEALLRGGHDKPD